MIFVENIIIYDMVIKKYNASTESKFFKWSEKPLSWGTFYKISACLGQKYQSNERHMKI